MTNESYNKATLLLEQIEKIKALKQRIQTKHDQYKRTDTELCSILNSSFEALDVLLDINNEKFKNL